MGRRKLDIDRDIECRACKETKRGEFFYLDSSNGSPVRRKVCKECEKVQALKRYHAIPRDERYKTSRKRTCVNHGITVERFDEMVRAQGDVCAVCSKRPDRYYIDHDHNHCGGQHGCASCVRGLLCRNCNSALGFLDDNMDTLNRALNYLERYR